MDEQKAPQTKRLRKPKSRTGDIYLIGIDKDILEAIRKNKAETGVTINKFMEIAAREKLESQGWKPKSKKQSA